MNDVTRLFQAFVAPSIFVSATGLLILSNQRALDGHRQPAEAICPRQARRRTERPGARERGIHRTNQADRTACRNDPALPPYALISLVGTIASCLLLGIGLYWKSAALAAAVVFIVAMICLLVGTLYYIGEVLVSLSSVREEARDERFMDLGSQSQIRGQ